MLSSSEKLEMNTLRDFVREINEMAGTAEDPEVLVDIADYAGEMMQKFNIEGEIFSQ